MSTRTRPGQDPPPLAGVRVVAVEQYGAGPFATLFLADLGAEVIKIEHLASGGDIARYIPPIQEAGDSLFFETFNRGKRSITLDLANVDGRNVFERLVATADAVFSNLRGRQAVALGLTFEQLRSVNKRIVCVALSGYGSSEADGTRPGYDALVQAEAGWAALTGDPDGPPIKSGLSLVDYTAALVAALALVVGLFEVRRTGQGRDVSTNLFDAALAMLTYPATWALSAGVAVERLAGSAHPSVVPFQFFRTSDGHVAVACPKEKFFRALVDGLSCPEIARDERFASFAARRANRDQLLAILDDRFGAETTQVWLDRLGDTVPIAPVRELAEVLDPEALAARDMLAEYPHPRFSIVRSIGSPIKFAGSAPDYRRAPALGEDTDEVLLGLGFTAAEVSRLREIGALGRARDVSATETADERTVE